MTSEFHMRYHYRSIRYSFIQDEKGCLRSKARLFFAVMLFHAFFTTRMVLGISGQDPYSLGMGNSRLFYSGGICAAASNPAILGARFEPWGGAQLLPLCNSVAGGYWSDKLALTPYREFFSIGEDGQWQRLVTQLINQSFRVTGRSAGETSERITRAMEKGVSIFGGSNIALLGLTLDKIAVDVRTSVDVRADLPGAPFLILFSGEKGLKRGGSLPLTHLGAQARVYTDINFAYGLPVDLSGIIEKINAFTRGFTDLQYASWGAGLTLTMGNGYLDLTTERGGVHWNEDSTELFVEADLNMKTCGSGLHDNWKFGSPFEESILPAGGGAGINAGLFMYGEHTTLGVALRRLGPMVWRDIREANLALRTRDLSVAALFENDFDAFDSSRGGEYPDAETSGRLHTGPKQFEWQPTRLNVGFGYRFDFRHREEKAMHALSEYLNTAFEYEQSLAPWPGRSFVPRVALGAENGFLWGFLPVRIGFIFGGAEKIASSAGFAIGWRTIRFQVGYEAIGTPFWFPRRGFELALGLSTEWRSDRDPDEDGISDRTDRCPFRKEDKDGYADEDGCPDPDNDGDKKPDAADKCPNEAEDVDGFADGDGCPDFDNDRDSILDTTDRCPLQAEDRDGFKDDDGCPDFDNDGDGVADSVDRCINTAEDLDGYGDDDGCPDTDADGDAIPDTLDRCPAAAEVRNFIDDDDGCPDSAVSFTPAQSAYLKSLLSRVGFTSSGRLKRSAGTALDSLAHLLAGFGEQRYSVIWCDTTISDSVCLLRTVAVAARLAELGMETGRIVVPGTAGYGCVENGYARGLSVRLITSEQEYLVITGSNQPEAAVPEE
jgi:hypothetical protein